MHDFPGKQGEKIAGFLLGTHVHMTRGFRFEGKVINTFWHHSLVLQKIDHAPVGFYSAALLDLVCIKLRPCL